jgi:hypothetical protein
VGRGRGVIKKEEEGGRPQLWRVERKCSEDKGRGMRKLKLQRK